MHEIIDLRFLLKMSNIYIANSQTMIVTLQNFLGWFRNLFFPNKILLLLNAGMKKVFIFYFTVSRVTMQSWISISLCCKHIRRNISTKNLLKTRNLPVCRQGSIFFFIGFLCVWIKQILQIIFASWWKTAFYCKAKNCFREISLYRFLLRRNIKQTHNSQT